MPTWDPRANDLFLEAQGLTAIERQEFLDRACADDAALRTDVNSLLDVSDRAGDFLERPAGSKATSERPGTAIGPYHLIEQIGEGGMGIVFMAEQTHPVTRKVALKIVKAGMDTRQVVARFEAERQVLALMDHPNIAKVFDAGTTPRGRPYFVMELVRGEPINNYCDELRLHPRQRLELFVAVCQAVQHAHQKGVIHRDLKPSNILVTRYDGKPVVKIIDFGVAKATGPRLSKQTLFTEIGAVLGTLEYMSPEQAELNNQDIDTRSDVYSLGVLLYELLTGTTPLDRQRIKQTAFVEVLRLIREEEAPKPSSRLSDTQVAAQRRMEPTSLTRLVRGELDWIVLKTLDKDRTRRYESANELAADVERYLRDEPVLACPPSTGYRLRKLARRNRIAVTTAGLFGVILLLVAVAAAWGVWKYTSDLQVAKIIAEINRREAGRQRQVAIDNLRAVVADIQDLENSRPELDDIRQDLLVRLQRYLSVILADPAHSVEADEAEFWLEIHVGDLCRDQDHQLPSARAHYERALAITDRFPAEKDSGRIQRRLRSFAQSRLGDTLIQLGDPVSGTRLYAEMLSLRQQLCEEQSDRIARADLAVAHLKVGDGYCRLRQFGEPTWRKVKSVSHSELSTLIEVHYGTCHALYAALFREFPQEIEYSRMFGHACDRLVDVWLVRADWGRAISAARTGLDFRASARAKFPGRELAFDTDGTYGLDRLSFSYCHAKDFAAAKQAAEASLAIRTDLVQRNPRSIWFKRFLILSYQRLAQAWFAQGNYGQAVANFDRAYAILKPISEEAPHSDELRGAAIDLIDQLINASLHLDPTGEATKLYLAEQRAYELKHPAPHRGASERVPDSP